MNLNRRRILCAGSAVGLGLTATVALPETRRSLTRMTDGPFYPPRAWRESWTDSDADLTRNGSAGPALGEHLGLDAVVVDTDGRALDATQVEIWQCDALQAYRHPGVPQREGRYDPGFQGFGTTRSGPRGELALRTIRPVPYPGRAPHIHVKLRHPSFGEWTSQLFVADDPGNARDFLWRHVPEANRDALSLRLQPAEPGSGLRWQARHVLVVPA